MVNKKLSNRLTACLEALAPSKTIADIGTDHAYLPCFGIATGKLKSAIAIDVIEGPLMQARSTIKDYGLENHIEVRQGSGLEPLKHAEVEGIVIAGMGGKLISQLLTDSITIAKSVKKLVLQPNAGDHILRKMLFENNFEIIDEKLILEDGHLYPIIVAIPESPQKYSSDDIMFGPILKLNVTNPLFIMKCEREIIKIDTVLNNLPENHPRILHFKEQKQQIRNVMRHDSSQ